MGELPAHGCVLTLRALQLTQHGACGLSVAVLSGGFEVASLLDNMAHQWLASHHVCTCRQLP